MFGNLTDDGYYDEADRKLSDTLQYAWTAFARNGAPSLPNGFEWPRYEGNEPMATWIEEEVEFRAFPVAELTSTINKLRAT